jgi:hypothetical protein
MVVFLNLYTTGNTLGHVVGNATIEIDCVGLEVSDLHSYT